jgi:hypothetical protein
MTIGPGEEYIPQLDKFVGKVDMGDIIHPKDQYKLANKMLGYIVMGLNRYFKIPVAYFLVSHLTAKEQEALLLQVFKDVEDCGFKINRLVTDNLAVNTNMFKRMNGGVLHPVIRHPIQEYRGVRHSKKTHTPVPKSNIKTRETVFSSLFYQIFLLFSCLQKFP